MWLLMLKSYPLVLNLDSMNISFVSFYKLYVIFKAISKAVAGLIGKHENFGRKILLISYCSTLIEKIAMKNSHK